MAHPVSCGVCSATFSIPDEVWEKRVEGQLATLKCRHCKAPIQIDGRTKRNANSLVESRAVVDPKPAVGSAPTTTKQEAQVPAATPVNDSPTGVEKAPAAKPPASTAVVSAGASREQSKIKPAPADPVKQPSLAKPRERMSSAELTATQQPSHEKPADAHALRTGAAFHLDVATKKGEERPSKKDEQPTKDARGRGTSLGSKPRAAEPIRESSAELTDSAIDKEPASAKKRAPAAKVSTAGHPEVGKPQHTPAAKPDTTVTAVAVERQPAHAEKLDPPALTAEQRQPDAHHQTTSGGRDTGESQQVAKSTATAAATNTEQQVQVMTPAPAKTTSRGGGPPPLRKAAASAPDLAGNAKAKPPEVAGTERHGPPPLPRQASVHDAEAHHTQQADASHEEAPRVHSPASMPVVAAMAVPFAGARTPSLAPRPSDIAALVKLRPKFPKWLPFAVLGAAVLVVAGFAALSWLRGDVAVEKSPSAASSVVMPYPQNTASIPSPKSSAALPAASPTGSDSRSNAAEFANQFAQAAAKQRTSHFDREIAEKALAAAFIKAASCHNRGDPTGAARVTISIAPSGQVLSVTVAPPFAGTYTAECIRNALGEARSEPFQGAPGRLIHSISIR